ncbi:TPA: carbonic anhydrase family protein [Citrobacter koseri]|nr:carbonic anhydrase family protein [Citrobacter koseri]
MKLISLTTAFLAICMMPVSVSATDWSYEGDTSPAHWGEINKAYKLCQTGMSQSPVDILTTNEIQLPPLNVQYIDRADMLLNVNHTLQATMNSYSSASAQIDDQPYALAEFHFHAPSENTINGKHYAMELHLTHKNQEGEIAVVAVMFDIGEPNEAIERLWQSIPATPGDSIPLLSPVDINLLLPEDRTYWRFSGSLTTPPCSEGVTWIVLKQPMTLSAGQLEKFRHTIHPANNRPVQPLNGRVINEWSIPTLRDPVLK